MNADS
jgi:hypothetical protein